MASDNVKNQMRPAPSDDLDDLFDYDAGMDDAFDEINENKTSKQQGSVETEGASGLGIDEEVKITKKRQPIAKLDETRLLSAAGIPKLRKISKERLRFKGKGHEFSDIRRLLNMYQFWLDDLYPRAKLADGLAIVEKLGHSKRIQMMRKQWIDEGKPKTTIEAMSEEDGGPTETFSGQNIQTEEPHDSSVAHPEPAQQLNLENIRDQERTNVTNTNNTDNPEDDELDALLAEDSSHVEAQSKSLFGSGSALSTNRLNSTAAPEEEDFADEMEIMAEMDHPW